MRIIPTPKIDKELLMHTREWARRGHLGLDPVIMVSGCVGDWAGACVRVIQRFDFGGLGWVGKCSETRVNPYRQRRRARVRTNMYACAGRSHIYWCTERQGHVNWRTGRKGIRASVNTNLYLHGQDIRMYWPHNTYEQTYIRKCEIEVCIGCTIYNGIFVKYICS